MRRPTVPRALAAVVTAGVLAVAAASPASAALPEHPGCTASSLPANDDGSTGAIDPGFTAHFGNQTFPTLFVNNNGNVTFGAAFGSFTPFDFTTTEQTRAIVAPFFADVDT